jgi:hypothetical protein
VGGIVSGSLAQDEARAKFGRSIPRWLSHLAVSHFFFSKTIDVPIFVFRLKSSDPSNLWGPDMGKFKMTRIEKPAIRERPIMHQSPPSGPKLSPAAPAAPKRADELKQNEVGTDPRQQVF